MRTASLLGALGLALAGCGPAAIAGSGDDTTRDSEGGETFAEGDGDPGDGDPGDGDPGDGDPGDGDPGDGDPGDGDPGDGDPGDGDPGDGDGDDEPQPFDLGAGDCDNPILDGSVELDETSSQAEFAALVCVEEITGDLEIIGTSLVELGFLAKLERVGGSLSIRSNVALSGLAGLAALEHVGGTVSIGHSPGLASLAGLSGLRELGGLSVYNNANMTSLAGLAGDVVLHAGSPDVDFVRIYISDNASLTSLDGLAGITSLTVERPLQLVFRRNEQLGGDLSGLSAWIEDEQQLSLTIADNALASLTGLEGLTTAENVRLLGRAGNYTSLFGLDNLVSVTETLEIGACKCIGGEVSSECGTNLGLDTLVSLDGLESLVSVGDLRIWGNEALISVDGLAGLMTVGDLSISDNPLLPAAAVDSLVAGLEITGVAWVGVNGTGNDPICGFIPQ